MKGILRKITVFLVLLGATIMMAGCGSQGKEILTIVYTNDIHSYIDNVKTDADGNALGNGLRLSKVKALVDDKKQEGKKVLLVDAGDQIQGDIYGAMDEGESIINMMNETGYDLAVPGNHDFDYGVSHLIALSKEADFEYLSCNFRSSATGETVFAASKIVEVDDKKVAFIGITTPETITSSTPVYFQDESGEFVYSFDGMVNASDLYESVQKEIDKVKTEADYVIAIGHIGIGLDEQALGISSMDIIKNTSGLNAFIDAHSHSTVEGTKVKDQKGKEVLLTQTGSYLSAVGVMSVLDNGKITTQLLNDYAREDSKVAELEAECIQVVTDRMGEKIGELENTLFIHDPENLDHRLIRSREMNLGDFAADSIYWFFNDRLEIDCDVAIVNAGGIRTQIGAGDLTYKNVKQVMPFGDMVCLITATGQQILDALEMGAIQIGKWDEEWDIPAENGGFLQVAGLSYTIDASVDNRVDTDQNGLFKGVTGDYKVKDVKIYNRASGTYEDIDLNREYTIGGSNYILRNEGNGLSMFSGDSLLVDFVGLDYVILAEYIKSFGDGINPGIVSTNNSPLMRYEGYLLDYENPFGANRIQIENIEH